MAAADLTRAEWQKAALSAHNGGCVEIAGGLTDVTGIRDSKNPGRGALAVTKAAFAAFLDDARNGRYSL
jgi:hypothetical protein